MIDIEKLQLVGTGFTAKVYLFEENKVIKLFNKDYDVGAVEYEAKIARAIDGAGVAAPKFYQTIEVNGQYGIIYEYVQGEPFFSLLINASFLQGVRLIKRMAQAQIEINQKNCQGLPSQIDRLSYLIGKAEGIEAYKDDLLKGLKAIKQESFICHGDFHAGNIIARDGRFVAIDWMNCYAGNKEGDLLRTYLMLVTPDLPSGLGKIKKALLTLYKKALGRVYLREYLKLSGLKKRDLIKWLPIIAAARLDDNIPSERKWLLKIIRKTIKFLRKR